MRVLVTKRYCRCGGGTQNKAAMPQGTRASIASNCLITINGGDANFATRYARDQVPKILAFRNSKNPRPQPAWATRPGQKRGMASTSIRALAKFATPPQASPPTQPTRLLLIKSRHLQLVTLGNGYRPAVGVLPWGGNLRTFNQAP